MIADVLAVALKDKKILRKLSVQRSKSLISVNSFTRKITQRTNVNRKESIECRPADPSLNFFGEFEQVKILP
jgi:hypothetical protein